jgi:hypothetical protein
MQGTSTDCSSAYVYQADEVVAVRREDARVEVDNRSLFDKDMTRICQPLGCRRSEP